MGIYLGLGSNIGDGEGHFRFAIHSLRDRGIAVWKCASLYSTQPRDVEDQPWFLNTVLEVRTLLEPELVMEECLDIERNAGRVRDVAKGPRPLDIDILLYRDRIVELPNLTIPHPRFRQRRFVMVPLAEVAPNAADPVSGLTMIQLLDLCVDEGIVHRFGEKLL